MQPVLSFSALCLFTWALYLLPAICLKWQRPQRSLPEGSLGLCPPPPPLLVPIAAPPGISIHRVRNSDDCLGKCEKSVQNAIKYAEHLHLAFNKTNTK